MVSCVFSFWGCVGYVNTMVEILACWDKRACRDRGSIFWRMTIVPLEDHKNSAMGLELL